MATSQHSWLAPSGGVYDPTAVCALVDGLPALTSLRDLPPAVHARLAMLARVRAFADGTVLLREGEAADSLFLILRGRVRLESAGAPTGADTDTLGPGSVLGPLALAEDDRQRATVRAVGAVEVLSLSHLAVVLTALQFPDSAAAMWQAFRA